MVTADKVVNVGVLRCPNCGGVGTIIEDPSTGELVCRACGFVLQDHVISEGPPWRVFDSSEVVGRVSAKVISPSLPNHGIGGSVIAVENRGGSVAAKLRALARRNRLIQYVENTERRAKELRDLLMGVKYRLNLPDSVIDDAIILYRQLSSRCDIKGARTRDLALVLLYMAIKKHRLGYQFRELKAALNTDGGKRVSRLLMTVKQCLAQQGGEGLIRSDEELGRFLERVIASLKLGEDIRYHVTKLSISMVKEGEKLRLTNGRTAYSLIASAVYIAATLMGARRRQRDVAEAAKVTDVTIRNRYKELISKLDIVIEV
ncbi:TFIIB-type zinc ribbon-containing protein [Vulcanisaeta thermophila]|uniref:TFIIB-type zinc ribbon-containing protein n=1 Tax=Vulcanisaeta thermophila TaxID=867917 RepID=UPI000852E9A3|nr:transcription initiation factor IIB family protein [Vulcanisaeta thermophila]